MEGLLRQTKRFCKRNASTILTTVGGVGVVATSVMAVKATPKALKSLEQAKQEKGEDLTKFEKVKAAGPAYIPSIAVGVGTIACIFGANMLNKRQQATMASAYALLDMKYKDYKNKVKEMYGEEGENKIKEAIANDQYDEVADKVEDDNKQLYYDVYSQRFFKATSATVLSAEYVINRILAEDCYASVNELYDLFEIDYIPGGDEIGWSAAQMCDMYWSSWIHFFHSKGTTEDGTDYIIIDFTDPTDDFGDY